jgi:hypothetical protein
LLGVAVLALFAALPVHAAELPAPDRAFVADHCTSCHNEVDRRGRLDLTSLVFAPNESANLAMWIKVHDRVKAGEMPPRTRARPDAARQTAFVDGLAQAIVAAERSALAGEGRAIQRRLNRQEYENALRDLLGVPWAPIANRLPEDGEAYGFNKSGRRLPRLVRFRLNDWRARRNYVWDLSRCEPILKEAQKAYESSPAFAFGRALRQKRPALRRPRTASTLGEGRRSLTLPSRELKIPAVGPSFGPTRRDGRKGMSVKFLRWLNAGVTRNLRAIEMIGVLMRIFSFSLVSWLGPSSPFLFVWAFNTTDAVMLSWCAIIKKDRAYTVLNVFWVGVGIVGMVRATGFAY